MDRDQTLMERYRMRAMQIRAIAEGMPQSRDRDLLLEVAGDYEKLGESGRILDQANRPHTDS